MTSSLVGSEMCIRDSPKLVLEGCAFPNSFHGAFPNSFHNSFHSSFPVSYTHLTLPTICSV
eukprot:6352185-Prorocentrum_lima.AAC.1